MAEFVAVPPTALFTNSTNSTASTSRSTEFDVVVSVRNTFIEVEREPLRKGTIQRQTSCPATWRQSSIDEATMGRAASVPLEEEPGYREAEVPLQIAARPSIGSASSTATYAPASFCTIVTPEGSFEQRPLAPRPLRIPEGTMMMAPEGSFLRPGSSHFSEMIPEGTILTQPTPTAQASGVAIAGLIAELAAEESAKGAGRGGGRPSKGGTTNSSDGEEPGAQDDEQRRIWRPTGKVFFVEVLKIAEDVGRHLQREFDVQAKAKFLSLPGGEGSCGLVATMHPDDLTRLRFPVERAAKDGIFERTNRTRGVCLLGFKAAPFKPLPDGFSTTLATVPSKRRECRRIYRNGTCRLGAACTWEHPSDMVKLDFTIRTDAAYPEESSENGVPGGDPGQSVFVGQSVRVDGSIQVGNVPVSTMATPGAFAFA